MLGVCEDLRTVSDPWELEVHAGCELSMWVVKTEPWTTGKQYAFLNAVKLSSHVFCYLLVCYTCVLAIKIISPLLIFFKAVTGEMAQQ